MGNTHSTRTGASQADVSAVLETKSTSLGLAARIAARAATARPNEGGNSVLETGTPVNGAGGGAAAHRLERRTHLDQAQYRVTLRNYGNGLAKSAGHSSQRYPPLRLYGAHRRNEKRTTTALDVEPNPAYVI